MLFFSSLSTVVSFETTWLIEPNNDCVIMLIYFTIFNRPVNIIKSEVHMNWMFKKADSNSWICFDTQM